MKKIKIFSLLGLLLPAYIFAQNPANPTKSDPEAKKILDAVSSKFKTFNSVQATFTYRVENGTGKQLSSKAGTILMKGTKYHVTFSGQEIYCDGSTIWNYDKSAKEV